MRIDVFLTNRLSYLWGILNSFFSPGREGEGGHDHRQTALHLFSSHHQTNFPTLVKQFVETCILSEKPANARSSLLLRTEMLSVSCVSTNLLCLVTLWLLVSSLRRFICKQLNSHSLTATCPWKEVLRVWRYIKTISPSLEESLNNERRLIREQERMANLKRKSTEEGQ